MEQNTQQTNYNINQQNSFSTSANSSTEQPIFVVKPKFILPLFILTMIPSEIFFTIWATMFFGIFGIFAVFFINAALHISLPTWLPAFIVLVFVIFGLPVLSYILSSKNYKKQNIDFLRID